MQATKVHEWLEQLEKQRRALKMTLPVLAKKANLSRATVCRILRDKKTSSRFEHVIAIASVLGVEFTVSLEAPEEVVERQIQRRARSIVRMVQGNMALEAQGITDQSHIDSLVETAAQEIRAKPRKQLW